MPLSKIQLKSASRNLIINGDFRIWQRGTSHTSTATNEYSADRFRTEGYGLSTTISRQAFTAGQTDVPNFPTYYARVATSAKPSSGQYWGLMQRIEAPLNARQGQTYTLSYWVRSTSGTVAASAFTYGFGGSGAARSNSPALTTTWQKVTNTLTSANLSGGGAYLSVYIMHVPDTAPSSMSVEIANVKVEEGHVATDFEHRTITEELSLCKRYYERSGLGFPWQANSTTEIWVGVSFEVEKRTAPTMTIITTNAALRMFEFGLGDRNSDSTPSIASVYSQTKSFLARIGNFSGISGGDVGMSAGLATDVTADIFQFDAEL